MKIAAAIMAGGKGERFWPMSRAARPKQFLSLTDDGITMLQHTVRRLLPMVAYEDMFIIANNAYMSIIREQVPEIPPENLLAEPMARNTSPCIGFAAAVMAEKYKDAVMLALPADHLISNEVLFLDTIRKAAGFASSGGRLVTIGISPSYPETGYGYVNFDKNKNIDGIYPVHRFVEKPNIEMAKEYIADGGYLWNSGMFVWTLSTILTVFEALHPDIYAGLMLIRKALNTEDYDRVLEECFNSFPSISIDYGVMERANGIYTIPGSFGWDDMGSWLALERISNKDPRGNVIRGDIIATETDNSIIISDKKLITSIGLKDLIIVDTPDALLICDKTYTQQIRQALEELRRDGRGEIL